MNILFDAPITAWRQLAGVWQECSTAALRDLAEPNAQLHAGWRKAARESLQWSTEHWLASTALANDLWRGQRDQADLKACGESAQGLAALQIDLANVLWSSGSRQASAIAQETAGWLDALAAARDANDIGLAHIHYGERLQTVCKVKLGEIAGTAAGIAPATLRWLQTSLAEPVPPAGKRKEAPAKPA